MKKTSNKINAKWYTKTHMVKHNPPIVLNAGNYSEECYIFSSDEEAEDGTLFSMGKFKTRVMEKDLPDWFCPARIYNRDGWVNVKSITDAKYKPNMFVNHLFKDDFLYIKFGGEITNDGDHNYNYDLCVWGWDIVNVVTFLDAYGVLPEDKINVIKQQILDKVGMYRLHYPHEHDAISIDKYKMIYADKLEETKKRMDERDGN